MKVQFKNHSAPIDIFLRARTSANSVVVSIRADTYCKTIPYILELQQTLERMIPFVWTSNSEPEIFVGFSETDTAVVYVVMHLDPPDGTVIWGPEWNVSEG